MANKVEVSRAKISKHKVNRTAVNKVRISKAANKARVALTSVRSNAVSIIFPSVCRRRSKARAARMVRALKRTSIAPGSWQTTSIHCGGVSMKTRVVAMVNNSKAINRVNNRVNQASAVNKVKKAKGKKASKDKRVEVSKVNRVGTVNRVRTVNKVSRVLRAVNSKVSKQVARKTAANQTVTANAAASIAWAKWATAGATIASCPPRFANVCTKRKTCDASGAQPDWVPGVSTK